VAQYEMLANVANYVDLASSKFLIIALVALPSSRSRVLLFSCSRVLSPTSRLLGIIFGQASLAHLSDAESIL
jgi:hypothetical protein